MGLRAYRHSKVHFEKKTKTTLHQTVGNGEGAELCLRRTRRETTDKCHGMSIPEQGTRATTTTSVVDKGMLE